MSALLLGALVAFILPMTLGGSDGVWAHSWANWGTIRPSSRSPGLIFSIPLFLGSALAFRLFFNWHKG
ncbi:MAG: hypothetical protein ACREBK_05655 [Sphingomicrobium sp.]